MPSSRVFAFADPIEYQAAIRAGDVTVTPTARGDFHAELTHIDFHRLWMQRAYESSPVIKFVASHRQRAPIYFLGRSEQPAAHCSGMDVSSGDIVVCGSGASIHLRTSAANRWAGMSLSPEDLAKTSHALAGFELSAPVDTYRSRPSCSLAAVAFSRRKPRPRCARSPDASRSGPVA